MSEMGNKYATGELNYKYYSNYIIILRHNGSLRLPSIN